jgi:hypothetical protein
MNGIAQSMMLDLALVVADSIAKAAMGWQLTTLNLSATHFEFSHRDLIYCGFAPSGWLVKY